MAAKALAHSGPFIAEKRHGGIISKTSSTGLGASHEHSAVTTVRRHYQDITIGPPCYGLPHPWIQLATKQNYLGKTQNIY